MCVSGATAGPAGLALQGAGAIAGAVGSYYTAKGQKIALGAAADASRADARISEINARTNLDVAELNNTTDAEITDLNARSLTGTAAINAALSRQISGSSALVLEGNAKIARQLGETNAEIAEQNAQDALRQGQKEEQISRLGTAQLKSTQRANMAANGIALDEGSAVQILTSTDYMGDVDAEIIHANAVRSAMGYRTQASNERIAGMIGELNANNEAAQVRIAGAADAMNIEQQAASTVLNQKLRATFDGIARTQAARLNAINQAIQATGFGNQARGYDTQNSAISPIGSGLTSLLNDAPAVASKWYSMNKAGAT